MTDHGLVDRALKAVGAREGGVDRSRSVFLLVVGLAVGVLVGGLVIPRTQDADVVTTQEGRSATRDHGDLAGREDVSPLEDESGPESAGRTGPSGSAGRGTSPAGTSASGVVNATGAPVPGGDDADAVQGEVRGVTDSSIKVGVALPDIEAFGNIDEDFNVGNQQEQMDAIRDAWQREGLLPLHGRDIEFVYERFDILSSEEKVAACNRFIKDHRVFAVIAGRFFDAGAECVAERFDTPLLTVNSALTSFYQRTAPFLFTLRAPWVELFRNWMAWADVNGHLDEKTIGLFYEEEVEPAVEEGIKAELNARGYQIREEVRASGSGIGTSQDQVAVQRFRNAGVDLVLLVAGGTTAINFMNFAEAQGYRPDYIDTDFGEHTTDAAAGALPPEQYDGTPAMTATRVGEVAAKMPLPRETTECMRNYERFSGREVGHRSPETAEYGNILITCDLAEVMLRALTRAGPALHAGRLIAGFEGITDMPLALHGNLSYGPGRHAGVFQQRTVQWRRDCECWTAFGEMSRFFL